MTSSHPKRVAGWPSQGSGACALLSLENRFIAVGILRIFLRNWQISLQKSARAIAGSIHLAASSTVPREFSPSPFRGPPNDHASAQNENRQRKPRIDANANRPHSAPY